MRLDVYKVLFSTFNCSMETALSILGIDFNDELSKRKIENEKGVDGIFTPHASQYTSSGNDGGRPANDDVENVDKQEYDNNRNNDS